MSNGDSSPSDSRQSKIFDRGFPKFLRNGNDIESPEATRGPLGLNLLSSPPDPIVDFVFVHGLKGGSRKTWSKTADSTSFWPSEFLRRDADFKNVRIHSFGYDSDWVDFRTSALGINDFGKALLSALYGCQEIRRDHDLPIVLVGHSMGGLVIKKAFLLAKWQPDYKEFAKRFHAMFFLATPHRGASYPDILSNILKVYKLGRDSVYVSDLQRNSVAVQEINEDFRNAYLIDDLRLFSFYESKTTFHKMVVPKESAVLDYPKEHQIPLNADHRGICKFDSSDDPDYRTLRNSFVIVIEEIYESMFLSKNPSDRSGRRRLKEFLGIPDRLEDTYVDLNEPRTEGSCEWLLKEESFLQWRKCEGKKILWLTGGPGIGKSFLAHFVFENLKLENADCSDFFFIEGDHLKANLDKCLLSIAYQMALSNRKVREKLLEMIDDDIPVDKEDFRSIWRRLFINTIVKEDLERPHFWVLDAVDECVEQNELLSLLLEIRPTFPLYLLITSRPSLRLEDQHENAKEAVETIRIQPHNTAHDISLYIDKHLHFLEREEPEVRDKLKSDIIRKSESCFLWVRLVVKELRRVHVPSESKKILEDVPLDMDALYKRALEKMSKENYGKDLAKAILKWTACAVRPLNTSELEHALCIEIGEHINDVKSPATTLCGDLLYIDPHSNLHMVHQTARRFLLTPDDSLEFVFDEKDGHLQLALTCLEYLCSDEMQAPRGRRPSLASQNTPRSPFLKYAALCFHEHVGKADPTSEVLLRALHKFFKSTTVLTWMEHVASRNNLYQLVRTGLMLRGYLNRRAATLPPLGMEVQVLESWSVDLIRVVAKFSRNLLKCPPSVYNIVPPFCPKGSAIHSQFGNSTRGIEVKGVDAAAWDDCLACIIFRKSTPLVVATTGSNFAVGANDGVIHIYNASTAQELSKLACSKPIKFLKYNLSGKLLASATRKRVYVWDVVGRRLLIASDTTSQCLAATFTEDRRTFITACKDNKLRFFDLDSGDCIRTEPWYMDRENSEPINQSAVTAAFSPGLKLLAFVYRGDHIHLWDWEKEEYIGTCQKPEAEYQAAPFHAKYLCFSPSKHVKLLAAAYQGGEIIVFDPEEGDVINSYQAETNDQTLASSPDGRTLIAGDQNGTLRIFDFETLKLIHIIRSPDNFVRSIAVCSDNQRFVDVRRSQAGVWEPPVMMRIDAGEERSAHSDEIHELSSSTIVTDDLITVIVPDALADCIIYGTRKGQVVAASTMDGKHHKLFEHSSCITKLDFNPKKQILSSVDTSNRVLVYELKRRSKGWFPQGPILDRRTSSEEAIEQLLLSPDCKRILVSCNQSDVICTIGSEKEVAVTWPSTNRWTWSQHPTNPNWFVLIAHDYVRIYAWTTFEEITTAPGIKLGIRDNPGYEIKQSFPLMRGDLLVTVYAEPHKRRSQACLHVWKASDAFDVNRTEVSPHAQLQILADALSNMIRTFGTIIGASNHNTLLFLDHDGWICSVGIDKNLAMPKSYRRHFFLPNDWLSTDRELLFASQGKNDILFAKGPELAIVKNGLPCLETMAFEAGPPASVLKAVGSLSRRSTGGIG